MGGSIDRVDICKIKFYICRVVLNPQLGLIDSNRRVSSDMEPQSTDPHRSNELDLYEMRTKDVVCLWKFENLWIVIKFNLELKLENRFYY